MATARAALPTSKSFNDILADGVEACKLPSAEAGRLYARLKHNDILTVGTLARFSNSSLRAANTRTNGLDLLKQLLIGAGPGTGPTDSPQLEQTLAYLADHCTGQYGAELASMYSAAPPAGSAAPKATADADDRTSAKAAYSDLFRYQGHNVPLDCKLAAGTIGRMRKEVIESDYIESIPSVKNVPLACRLGARRDISLGQMADGNTVSVSLSGEGNVGAAKTFAAVQHNVRALLYGILAALSRPISLTAYGGGQSGIVRVPAESRQIRLQFSLAKCDRLVWKLIELATGFGADVNAYINTCDNAIFEFAKHCEAVTMHPDEIVDYLIDQRPALFSTADDGFSISGSSSRSRGSSTGTPAPGPQDTASGGEGKNGICSSWLQNGGCRKYNEGTCLADHPPSQKGALKGAGQRRYQPYPQPAYQQPWNSGHGGGWSWDNDWSGWAPYQKPAKKGNKPPGKGKGKWGGKGKGKGK